MKVTLRRLVVIQSPKVRQARMVRLPWETVKVVLRGLDFQADADLVRAVCSLEELR